MRYVMGLEYEGTAYHGWQVQESISSIQAAVEQALTQVAAHPITVVCAGRTDKGVHALQQIVHFDSTAERPLHAWVTGTNRFLPPTIRVHWVKPISEDFHARFSAQARRYAYVLYCHSIRPALLHSQVSWCYYSLNIEAMREAAAYLLGEHNFASFQGSDCQAKSPIRTVLHIELIDKAPLLIMDIKANAFLQHMVRNIAGALLEVGMGRQPVSWMQEVLAACNRQAGAKTASASGLYFLDVDYPAHFDLPKQRPFAWFL